MRREINPDTVHKDGEIHVKDASCPGVCLKIFKGGETPDCCPHYEPRGKAQFCTMPCEE